MDALMQFVSEHINILDALSFFYMIDSGAFFINYILTITFVSNAFELLRIPDLAISKWKELKTALSRDVLKTHNNQSAPFAYGIQVYLIEISR